MEGTGRQSQFVNKLLLQPKLRAFAVNGLYIDVANIQANTRPGRAIAEIKQALREWVGEGTAGTELLIQRIAYKVLRLSL